MGTYAMIRQLRAGWERRPCCGRRAVRFLLRAARKGFFNAWPIGLAGLALLIATAAHGAEPAENAGFRSGEPITVGLSEPVRGVLQLGAIAGLALLVAHLARTEESRGRRRVGRGLITLAGLALVARPALAGAEQSDDGPKSEVKHFTSGGKKIAVEYFAPAAAGKHPVLVTLHAVDGIAGALAPMYRIIARDYAGQGYVVLLVHYFDRTGAGKKDVDEYRELFVNYFRRKEHTDEQLKQIKELSGQWTAVVRDAVAFARALGNVDGERVGLVGFSLGATMALAAAAEHDLKAAALVEMFGALPPEMRPGLKKLPPTLVIHGEDDGIVPADEAYSLIGRLVAEGRPCEAAVYPGVGHMFFRDGKGVQLAQLLTAKQRVSEFLGRHLTQRVATTAGK